MADVQPLQGLRYAQVSDLAQVITPPFDVISQEAQERYYARHPYNIIRLELGQRQPIDNTLDNVYTRAAATLAEWRLAEVIKEEPVPCYYFYQQRFRYGNQSYTRTSLLARVRLEPWEARVVLPHEHIRTRDKEDRLQLLRACAANLSPIMCMYDDPQARIRHLLSNYAEQAAVQIIDEAGEEHRLHPITDPEQIRLIQDFFAPRQLYIADGHHRYTTALHYRDEIREQRRILHAQDGVNFVMMALIDLDDPGWLVLPTHRMLFDLSSQALQSLTPQHLERYFSVRQPATTDNMTVLAELARLGEQQAAFALKTKDQTLLLTANEQGRQRMAASGHSSAWNELDVSLVQLLLLEELLELTLDDVAAGRFVRYAHDTHEALQQLERGEAQAIILLNGMPLRQVCAVAQADDRMPQKSTYLYPKLVTGLAMNPLW